MGLKGLAIVLGAGASRGAKNGGEHEVPVDANFFTVAKKLWKSMHKKDSKTVGVWRGFKEGLKQAGVPDASLKSLENTATYLEARKSITLEKKSGHPANYGEILDNLNQVIYYTLKGTGGDQSCEIHKALFECVKPKVVISFNYDLIADQTLLEMEKLAWWKKEYCGTDGKGKGYGKRDTTIHFLKLHGSINWKKNGRGHRLIKKPSENRGFILPADAPGSPYIIPPIAVKNISGPLAGNWKAARSKLTDSKGCIIWGYSFPRTDNAALILFRTALRKTGRKNIIVVNPDYSVAERAEELLGLKKGTVKYCPSMERFLFDQKKLEIK
ncbi:MAG TPA: hypothetical protein VNK24_07865 [Elusimicrobiota bacterium]|nr:hypothetical protein [Elusimicrobiota bacterium]